MPSHWQHFWTTCSNKYEIFLIYCQCTMLSLYEFSSFASVLLENLSKYKKREPSWLSISRHLYRQMLLYACWRLPGLLSLSTASSLTVNELDDGVRYCFQLNCWQTPRFRIVILLIESGNVSNNLVYAIRESCQ